jgi:hypothetical protein
MKVYYRICTILLRLRPIDERLQMSGKIKKLPAMRVSYTFHVWSVKVGSYDMYLWYWRVSLP